ncbi:MAG: recombinase family protein, partial [Clostridia bacterium]|nr:recombinase family protein [Clostridia bacterium]
AEYQKRYDALVERFDTAKARQKVLAQQITDRQARRQQIELFLAGLKKREPLTVFRDEDWLAMVDYVTVTEDAGITVTFKDGTEIEV